MLEADCQWLDIDYSKFTKGQYVIKAPQSTNKTGGIGTLEGNSVCLIGARNTLLKQTQHFAGTPAKKKGTLRGLRLGSCISSFLQTTEKGYWACF